MSSGKVFLGVLAGFAAGALVGILFAPDKGSVTRQKLSKKGKEYGDELTQKFNEFIDGVTARYEQAAEDSTGKTEQ